MKAVRNARRWEIDYFRQMGVYDKVLPQERKGGLHSVLGAHWATAKKADDAHRSSLVTYRQGEQDVQRAQVVRDHAAHTVAQVSVQESRQGSRAALMHIDIIRAYFYADAVRGAYVQLPPEDQTDDDKYVCGKMVNTMYGMRERQHNIGKGSWASRSEKSSLAAPTATSGTDADWCTATTSASP